MAGNTSDNENVGNKSVDIVSEFLLDRNIRDTCTLNEMRSNFPSKYRTHDDITVLYESFVMKRKLIKEAVRRNIDEFYSKERVKSSNKKKQSIEEKIAVLDLKQLQLKKEMENAKKELSILQKNIVRCTEAVKDCHLLTKDMKECFNMDIFEGLDTDE